MDGVGNRSRLTAGIRAESTSGDTPGRRRLDRGAGAFATRCRGSRRVVRGGCWEHEKERSPRSDESAHEAVGPCRPQNVSVYSPSGTAEKYANVTRDRASSKPTGCPLAGPASVWTSQSTAPRAA